MHSPKLYRPYDGPITPETLPLLFAHQRLAFAGFSMMADDDDDDDSDDDDDLDIGDDDDQDDDADKGKKKPEDKGDDDADKDDDTLGDAGKKALQKERDRNKELRKELREAKAAANKKDDEGEVEKAVSAAEAKWKPRVIASAAKTALLAAGAEKPERLLKLVDHDDLDVSDEGDVLGLDDEVDRLKDEYPELFKKAGGKPGRIETGNRGGGQKPKSASEIQAARLARS